MCSTTNSSIPGEKLMAQEKRLLEMYSVIAYIWMKDTKIQMMRADQVKMLR